MSTCETRPKSTLQYCKCLSKSQYGLTCELNKDQHQTFKNQIELEVKHIIKQRELKITNTESKVMNQYKGLVYEERNDNINLSRFSA